MTKLHIPQEDMDQASEWMGGDFPIPPEGPGIPFTITTTKDDESEVGKVGTTTYKRGENEGGEYTYLVIDMLYEGDSGDPQRHGEFFNIDEDWGKGKLRAFIECLGEKYEEGMDLNSLNGLAFQCDVSHVESKKGKTSANLKYDTIVPEATGNAAPSEAGKPKPPPRRPQRSAR